MQSAPPPEPRPPLAHASFAVLAATCMTPGFLLPRWVPQAALCEAVEARVELSAARMCPREWRESDAVAQVAYEHRVPRWRTRRCLDASRQPPA